jgi:hypothetical protein
MSILNWLFGKKKESSSMVKTPAAAAPEKETHTPKEEVSRLCNNAMAAIERNDIAAALQDLTRAEALDPRDPLVQLLLFQAYGITRDYDSSAKHFQALRELDPATAEEALKGMPDSLQAKMNLIQNNDVEKKKDKVLENAKNWWLGKPDPKDGDFVCDVCGGKINEKDGTSLLGSYMRCRNCTETLFSRWDRGED